MPPDGHPSRSGRLRAGQQCGTVMLLSWSRLADELRHSGVLSSNESVAHIVVEDDGINVYLERR